VVDFEGESRVVRGRDVADTRGDEGGVVELAGVRDIVLGEALASVFLEEALTGLDGLHAMVNQSSREDLTRRTLGIEFLATSMHEVAHQRAAILTLEFLRKIRVKLVPISAMRRLDFLGELSNELCIKVIMDTISAKDDNVVGITERVVD
jgi:hypothetical protein